MNFIRGFFKGLALQVFTSFLVGVIVAYLNYYDRYIFSSLKSFDDLLSFLLDCLAPAFQTNIIFMVVGFVLIVLAIIKKKRLTFTIVASAALLIGLKPTATYFFPSAFDYNYLRLRFPDDLLGNFLFNVARINIGLLLFPVWAGFNEYGFSLTGYKAIKYVSGFIRGFFLQFVCAFLVGILYECYLMHFQGYGFDIWRSLNDSFSRGVMLNQAARHPALWTHIGFAIISLILLPKKTDDILDSIFLAGIIGIAAVLRFISPHVLWLNDFYTETAFGLTLALPFSVLMALWPKAYKVPQSQPQKQEKWPVLAKIIKMNDFVEGENFLRGTCLIKQNRTMPLLLKLAHSENAQSQKGEIKICNAAFLPYPKENQHLLIVGSPGSGKTQITYPIVEQVIARGDKAIIWDIKGTYIQALAGKEGIELLAPWDKRSLRWLPCLDILRPLDCQRAASVIIPANPRDPQPYFANAGRQILEAVLIHLNAQDKDWGWHDVWDAISRGKNHLIEILKQTADGRSVAALIEGDSKAGQDVYSTLIASTQNIRWLAKAWPNEGISLNRWLKSETGQRALILGGVPEYEDLSLSSANLAVQTIVSQILSLPDDPRRRIWLFLDELATLGKMDSLLQAFALGRSKGLCVVAGIQDIGKIEHLYSRELAKSIANTFATTIFLRCSDADTSRWASSVIGEMEVKELLHGERYSLRDGILKATFFPEETKHEAFRSKPVFMPSQIANFPNLAGALRVSGWPVAYLQWPFKPIPQDEALIEPADWLNQKAEIKPVSKPIISKPDQPQSVEKDSSDASWRLHNDVA